MAGYTKANAPLNNDSSPKPVTWATICYRASKARPAFYYKTRERHRKKNQRARKNHEAKLQRLRQEKRAPLLRVDMIAEPNLFTLLNARNSADRDALLQRQKDMIRALTALRKALEIWKDITFDFESTDVPDAVVTPS